jgi:hypothetical protein
VSRQDLQNDYLAKKRRAKKFRETDAENVQNAELDCNTKLQTLFCFYFYLFMYIKSENVFQTSHLALCRQQVNKN